MHFDHTSLIIGLGGTGGQVLRDLRKRMFDGALLNEGSPELPVVFAYIDACDELMRQHDLHWMTMEGMNAQVYPNEFLHINPIGGDPIVSNLDYYPQLKGLAEHCQELRFCQANCGAMQYRRVGHILLTVHKEEVICLLDSRVHALRQQTGYDAPSRIYIVSGLCGGTGSGTVAAVILLAHEHFPEVPIFVMAALPSEPPPAGHDTGRYMANAYAALKELNALNVKKGTPFTLIPFATAPGTTAVLTDSLYYLLTRGDEREEQMLRRLLSFETMETIEYDAAASEPYLRVRTKALASLSLKRILYPQKRIACRVAYNLLGQCILQMLYNNYVVERGFVEEMKEIDLGEFLGKGRLSDWCLDNESLTLQRPTLETDRKERIRTFDNQWEYVIFHYTELVKDDKNPLSALADIVQKDYDEFFRGAGVEAYYARKKKSAYAYAYKIADNIESELFMLWKPEQLGVMQVLMVAKALTDQIRSKIEEAKKEQEYWRERAEMYHLDNARMIAEYEDMNILMRFFHRNQILHDFSGILREAYVAKTYVAAYDFTQLLLKKIQSQLEMLVDSLQDFSHQLKDMAAYAGRIAIALSKPDSTQPTVVDLSNEETIMKFGQTVIADRDFMYLLSTNLCTYLADQVPDNDKSFGGLTRHFNGNDDAHRMADYVTYHLKKKYRSTPVIVGDIAFEAQEFRNPLFTTTLDALMDELHDASEIHRFANAVLSDVPVSLELDEAELKRVVPNNPHPDPCCTSLLVSLPEPRTGEEESFLASLRDAFQQATFHVCVNETDATDEITITRVHANFPIRAIRILPKLKEQYDQWMEHDKQRAMRTLHTEEAYADLPSLEVEEQDNQALLQEQEKTTDPFGLFF